MWMSGWVVQDAVILRCYVVAHFLNAYTISCSQVNSKIKPAGLMLHSHVILLRLLGECWKDQRMWMV